jgi:hypothetical protein
MVNNDASLTAVSIRATYCCPSAASRSDRGVRIVGDFLVGERDRVTDLRPVGILRHPLFPSCILVDVATASCQGITEELFFSGISINEWQNIDLIL